MKCLRSGLFAGLFLASVASFAPLARAGTASAGAADGPPQLLTDFKTSSPTPMATTSAVISSELKFPGWTFWTGGGGSLGVQATSSPAGAGTVYALLGSYPTPATSGGNYVGANYDISSARTEDVYIEFWAKMPGVKEGCKFLKIFGARTNSTGYANTTIYTDYTGAQYGAIRQIGYGDGTSIVNDSQRVISLSGVGSNIGRSAGTAVVSTPQGSAFSDWGSGWHHFRIHVRFNSGTTSANEVPNGEYYLEIDGKIYVDATGLFNRNPANGPIDHLEFFGWAQTEPQPFQLWYYDIRVSTGGFMSTPLPDPPANASVR